ncbi:DHA2 family efflux MFS transporter permease subunit [Lactiplantibacillus plantarum]|uniref:DHA2 family efflux MFS transporter permease subunit n=1 Tax=Lactiplantibacillus plantarum TaxID=1590 RepID=UPI0030AB11F7
MDKRVTNFTHPWLVLLPLMIGAFVGMLSETSLNIALPQLMNHLQIGQATIQWLVTGYMLIIGVVLPLSSLLTKWFTTKKLVVFGLLAFLLGSLISGLGINFTMVLIGRMIQGIGTGIILPLMFTVAVIIFPMDKLGAVNGILALVIMFAPAIGPTLTGLILGVGSWRDIFFVFVIFLTVALILSLLYCKNVNHITKASVDWTSILLSVIGFSGIIAGVSLSSEYGLFSWRVLLIIILGMIALGWYIWRQVTSKSPLLNLLIFKRRNFRLGALLVMLDFAIILSAMYLLPQYLQNGLHIPVSLTGIIMLPAGIVNALVSAISGRLYDNFGSKWPTRVGFFIAAIGTILLTQCDTNSMLWLVILAHTILMVGAPLAMSPAQTSALGALEKFESADGSTILNTLQQIIGALSTAITTSLLTFGKTSTSGSDQAISFVRGVHWGLYFTLLLAVIGLVVSLKGNDKGHFNSKDE